MTLSSCSGLLVVHTIAKIPLELKDMAGECSVTAGVQVYGVRGRIAQLGNQERRMSKFAIRLLTLAMFSMALIAVPLLRTAHAAGGDNPAPPASDSSKEKKKKNKSSSIDDPKFIEGYRAAYSTIYDRNDYTTAIAATTRFRRSGTSVRSRPTPTTCGPGSITDCGRSNRATAIRRNIT